MTVLIAKSAGGVWTTAGTWELEGGATSGSAPAVGDDCRLTSTSGSVTISSAGKCRSLDCTGYTKTLKVEKGLVIGTATINGSLALKLSEGMTLEVGAAGTFNFASSEAAPVVELGITCAGKNLGSASFSSLGKYKFLDKFKAAVQINAKRGLINFNGQTVETEQFIREGELVLEIKMTSSTVKAGEWLMAGGAVVKPETSTLEVSGFELSDNIGTAYNVVSLTTTPSGTTHINSSITTTTLNIATNAAAQIVLTEGVIVTAATVTNNGKAGALNIIKSGTAGKPAKLKKASGTTELDYIEFKDITGEGEEIWYVGANSKDNGGNTGLKFAVPSATGLLFMIC
jgi:hypothetical protein